MTTELSINKMKPFVNEAIRSDRYHSAWFLALTSVWSGLFISRVISTYPNLPKLAKLTEGRWSHFNDDITEWRHQCSINLRKYAAKMSLVFTDMIVNNINHCIYICHWVWYFFQHRGGKQELNMSPDYNLQLFNKTLHRVVGQLILLCFSVHNVFNSYEKIRIVIVCIIHIYSFSFSLLN